MKINTKTISQKSTYWMGVITIGIFVGLSLQFVRATWSEPTSTAPNGNVGAPINISNTGQSKLGNLLLNQNGTYANGLLVPNGNVGIGTVSPGARLEVAGQIKITGGSPGAGKVLTSDASGLASWIAPSGGGGLSGSGTGNYVSKWATGTTLGNSRIFDNGTNVGIGTASPASKLDVIGGIKGTVMYADIYLSNPAGGFMMYDTTNSRWWFWKGGTFGGEVSAPSVRAKTTGYYFPDGTLQTTAATPPPPGITAAKFYTQEGTPGLLTVSCNAGDVMTGGSCYGRDVCNGSDSSGHGGYPSGSNGWTCPAIGCTSTIAYARCYDL